ncbi:unnamed protein product, partial [Brenthis ino]
MASHWTSKNAILRDLSLAQGREVPVELENTVGYNEKPPALNYTEETEEEFFSNCVGGGDCNTGPDLQLIQQMLDMVREAEIEDLETKNETVIEISKGNNLSKTPPVLDVKNNGSKKLKSPISSEIKLKQKKNRNAAVESLIATYGDIDLNESNQEQNTKVTTKSDTDNSMTRYQYLKLTSPMLMFKKKSPTKLIENVDKSEKDVSTEIDSIEPAKFVPSAFAGERYQKYLEMSKMQEQMQDDIWSKAEQKMKEIDARKREERKLESSLSSSSSNQDRSSPELRGMDFVRLPEHRHLLTGECTVCQVLCVHSIEDSMKNTQK